MTPSVPREVRVDLDETELVELALDVERQRIRGGKSARGVAVDRAADPRADQITAPRHRHIPHRLEGGGLPRLHAAEWLRMVVLTADRQPSLVGEDEVREGAGDAVRRGDLAAHSELGPGLHWVRRLPPRPDELDRV